MAKRSEKLAATPLTPEQFLAGYPLDVQILAHELRLLVKAAIPDVYEKVAPGWQLIGYRTPTQRGTIYFCHVAPRPDRVDLGFEQGVLMNDPDGRLQGGPKMRQVRYVPMRSMADIEPAPLTALIHEAERISALSKIEKELLKAAHNLG
jgi:hypothetical protein